jgi:uncharacterized protein YqgC (DUF456 family)
LTPTQISPVQLATHNIDAIVAFLALPLFAVTGLPLEGWFWATALWAANRFLQSRVERWAARQSALRGVGVMGASMLLRPWIGMLVLFLITRHDRALALSATLLFVVLVTIDIATRIVSHRNFRTQIGGTV